MSFGYAFSARFRADQPRRLAARDEAKRHMPCPFRSRSVWRRAQLSVQSLREAEPLQQRPEPRIRAERIEAGIPGEVQEGQILFFGSRHDLESRVDFPERAEQPGLGDDGG